MASIIQCYVGLWLAGLRALLTRPCRERQSQSSNDSWQSCISWSHAADRVFQLAVGSREPLSGSGSAWFCLRAFSPHLYLVGHAAADFVFTARLLHGTAYRPNAFATGPADFCEASNGPDSIIASVNRHTKPNQSIFLIGSQNDCFSASSSLSMCLLQSTSHRLT